MDKLIIILLSLTLSASAGSIESKWQLNRYNPPLGAVFITGEDWGFSATTLDDLSPEERDGTIQGATYDATAGPNGGPALQFNGTTGWINAGNVLLNTEMTLMCWAKMTALGSSTSRAIWTRNAGLALEQQLLRFNKTTGYIYADTSMADFIGFATTTNGYSVGVWYHVALTFSLSGDVSTIYVNGEQAQTVTPLVAGTRPSSTNPVNIGRDNRATAYFAGYLTEVARFTRVYSLAELKAVYQKGVAK